MGKPASEASEEAASAIGPTVAVAVLFSLLVARLITPMMAAYFLKDNLSAEPEKDFPVMRSYMTILAWTLRNRTGAD